MFNDNKRIPEEQAHRVIAEGKWVGDGCHEKDCFWRGYRHDGKTYIGLNDSDWLWEATEEEMLAHCTEE